MNKLSFEKRERADQSEVGGSTWGCFKAQGSHQSDDSRNKVNELESHFCFCIFSRPVTVLVLLTCQTPRAASIYLLSSNILDSHSSC